ncbi:MAG: phenylalanine--tRNA ligase subunit alpha [Clostridiales Family XIII bacterium]|jgi:phenylalanyl-tRNA synthetase alpha chain|nr:phenylalanine--tRNA ligase subunit alpha [Clostridiales Family XIII bacterium]
MLANPNDLLKQAEEQLAAAKSEQDIEAVRIRFLGKKGELTAILRSMGSLSPEERKQLGQEANTVRDRITELVDGRKASILSAQQSEKLRTERIDVTEPGRLQNVGARHLITQIIDEITRIFGNMGYSVTEGPEVETVFHNFDALNAAPNHPSRDLTDTFYISEDILLRTQTSPVQVRTLLRSAPPIKVISPGRCFRTDTPDATHSPMFHQVEGLLVDEGVTMTDLKGTLDAFAKRMFGEDVRTKFRPHFFPFTEPSAEMDMSCFACGGSGCRVCKGSGWIEILGCGMVHPNVLKVGGVDTERYTGFAFGMGVERIAMLRHGVADIRLFYENDVRFLNQFA